MRQKAPAADTPNDELTYVRQSWVGYENELQRDKRTVVRRQRWRAVGDANSHKTNNATLKTQTECASTVWHLMELRQTNSEEMNYELKLISYVLMCVFMLVCG